MTEKMLEELREYQSLCNTPGIDVSFKYQAAINFLRAHHSAIEAAVRDGARWRFLRSAEPDAIDGVVDLIMTCADGPDLDAAMDEAIAQHSGREG